MREKDTGLSAHVQTDLVVAANVAKQLTSDGYCDAALLTDCRCWSPLVSNPPTHTDTSTHLHSPLNLVNQLLYERH